MGVLALALILTPTRLRDVRWYGDSLSPKATASLVLDLAQFCKLVKKALEDDYPTGATGEDEVLYIHSTIRITSESAAVILATSRKLKQSPYSLTVNEDLRSAMILLDSFMKHVSDFGTQHSHRVTFPKSDQIENALLARCQGLEGWYEGHAPKPKW